MSTLLEENAAIQRFAALNGLSASHVVDTLRRLAETLQIRHHRLREDQ